MDRFPAAVKGAVLGEAGQLAGGNPFVVVGHRQVRAVPVAKDPQPLEFLPLDVDEFGGILPALLAHLQLCHFMFLRSKILLHLQFDRQPMAVPSRGVRGIKPAHPLAFEDDVLEDLVERMPYVNMAICVRRAIVQHVGRLSGCSRREFPIQVRLFPAIENFQFFLGEIGLHGEIGNRQIECVLVIHWSLRM